MESWTERFFTRAHLRSNVPSQLGILLAHCARAFSSLPPLACRRQPAGARCRGRRRMEGRDDVLDLHQHDDDTMWRVMESPVRLVSCRLRNGGSERKLKKAPHHQSDAEPSNCPSWARTRTLLIQSQACCQLHQGAVLPSIVMELRGIEPLTSAVRLQRSPS